MLGVDPQHVVDQRFLEGLVTNQQQVIDDQDPLRKQRVIEALRRTRDRGGRRGGPRRQTLLDLRDLVPGDHDNGNKESICVSMLDVGIFERQSGK